MRRKHLPIIRNLSGCAMLLFFAIALASHPANQKVLKTKEKRVTKRQPSTLKNDSTNEALYLFRGVGGKSRIAVGGK